MLWLHSVITWCLILLMAVANGLLRERVLRPAFGPTAGLLLSGLLLSAGIAFVAWVFVRRQPALTARRALAVGGGWLALTLVFEFGLGRLVQHKPWSELMGAYTFEGGNLWPVVLLVTALAPWAAARARGG